MEVILLLITIVNTVVLIGFANFMVRFSESWNKFIMEHREFQEEHREFIAEVRGKKGLVEILNRNLPGS
jgi:hypothetical protein